MVLVSIPIDAKEGSASDLATPAEGGGTRDRRYTAKAARIGEAFCHVKNLDMSFGVRMHGP